jgi:Spy/CpxP family protein refolding chaperone
MEQLLSLHREAQSQIQTVCSDTSLTPQQKQKQVQEIHQQTHQKIEGLITPEQEKTLMACRQQRRGEHHPGGQLGMGGGCGWGRGGARHGAPNSRTQDSGGSDNPPPSTESSPEN